MYETEYLMINSQAEKKLNNNLSYMEDDSLVVPYLTDQKRSKLLKLQHKLQRLREEISNTMLQPLQECRSCFEDANKIVGELLNDKFKINS